MVLLSWLSHGLEATGADNPITAALQASDVLVPWNLRQNLTRLLLPLTQHAPTIALPSHHRAGLPRAWRP